MTKRYIEELTKEELVEVFNANEKLRSEITEDMYDSEMHWVGEQLDFIRKSLYDWSIGAYNHNYIKVKDMDGFIDGLIEMDGSIPLFSDEEAKQLYKVQEMKEDFYDMDSDDDGYDEAEEDLEAAVKDLADDVARKLGDRLEGAYNEEYMLDYFQEFYIDARMEEGSFYIEDDSYELFEEVNYTKSYR